MDPTPWDRLTATARVLADGLSAPEAGAAGLCRTCFCPAPPGRSRCYPCDLHQQCAPGLLASAVLPVAYAVKGSAHARRLWVYKSAAPGAAAGAAAARRALAVLLLVFLREHGPCLWRAAGWDGVPGAGPTHAAVVPSGRGRAGPHPLRALAQPYLRLPWAELSAAPGADSRTRELDPARFTAARPGGARLDGAPLDGARVLLIDDTWATGASVQSAAMALRRAGAAAVAAVVLGRHLARPAGESAPAGAAFSPGRCAAHLPRP
jgi:hypothetical protein